jgi:hypothetical protein
MHDLAAELGLRRTYFLGPRQQDELAVLFNCADVGCFPPTASRSAWCSSSAWPAAPR